LPEDDRLSTSVSHSSSRRGHAALSHTCERGRGAFSHRRKTTRRCGLIHYRANAIIIVSSERAGRARRTVYLFAAARDPLKTDFQLTDGGRKITYRDRRVQTVVSDADINPFLF